MKNTKEITTGAMLLAIYGALLLIDRQFSFVLIEILALAVPVLIIVFGNLYNAKDGVFFSIAILFLAFILSPSPYTYFYIPVGIIIGNAYNFMLYKGVSSKIIMVIIIILFAIADLCYMLVISPVFIGYSFNDLLNETTEVFNKTISMFPVELNIDINKIVKVATYTSILITGIMEGFITHIMTFFLFRRFKINKMSFSPRGILVLKPVAAYILIIGSSLSAFSFRVNNDNLTSIMFVVGSICMFILIYYGYIYILMFTRLRTRKNMALLIIFGILFLFPLSLLILMIIGFLYGAGPLKKYLIVGQGGNNEKS